jgi:hypothetical protein
MSYEVTAEAVNVEQAPEKASAEKRELDDNDIPFVKSSNGTAVFGKIGEEQANAMGTNVAAPVKLSEGNSQYGEERINHRLPQLQQNGYGSVEEFVEAVANSYDEIREGNIYIDEKGNEKKTFLLIKNGGKGSVLFVELSPNNEYYDVNSGGVFNNKYIDKKELLWSGGTHQAQPSSEAADVSIGHPEVSPSENPGAPLSQSNPFSTGKGSENNLPDNTPAAENPNEQEKSKFRRP